LATRPLAKSKFNLSAGPSAENPVTMRRNSVTAAAANEALKLITAGCGSSAFWM